MLKTAQTERLITAVWKEYIFSILEVFEVTEKKVKVQI